MLDGLGKQAGDGNAATRIDALPDALGGLGLVVVCGAAPVIPQGETGFAQFALYCHTHLHPAVPVVGIQVAQGAGNLVHGAAHNVPFGRSLPNPWRHSVGHGWRIQLGGLAGGLARGCQAFMRPLAVSNRVRSILGEFQRIAQDAQETANLGQHNRLVADV